MLHTIKSFFFNYYIGQVKDVSELDEYNRTYALTVTDSNAWKVRFKRSIWV